MAVPKKRHTKSRRNKRRSHLALSPSIILRCEKCKKIVGHHMVCENCGTYKGKEVIDVLARLDKKERKRKEKELALQETAPAAGPDGLSAEELSKK